MNKFTCTGFNAVNAENMSDAARIFADRAAKRKYGRSAYSRTCVQQSYTQDGRLAEYSAFIGYTTGQNETSGNNINFTVFLAESAR